MRVLVTGSRGNVGRAAITALLHAGHDVVGTDVTRPVYELPMEEGALYVQANLSDSGESYAVVRGCEAVVHCAAIRMVGRNSPHFVFTNNMLSTFNVVEAAVSFGVKRLVNISSAAVAGYATVERQFVPACLPTDENDPPHPRDVYALAKHFGEQLMDEIVARSDVRCISLRPSWVQGPDTYAMNLGMGIREPHPRLGRWNYVDISDLANAIVLAVNSDLPGHEVFHIAAADNALGRPLEELVAQFFPEQIRVLPLSRPDASSVSSDKARRLLGYTPERSWRDSLGDQSEPNARDLAVEALSST
jgi:UDP-glucose 4-epimerase